MFETILVAIDGSDHANKAISLGSDLAAIYGARLVFTHVLLNHPTADQIRQLVSLERLTKTARTDFERFEEIQKKAASTSGVPIAVDIPFPSEVLVAVGDILLRDAERAAEKSGVKDIARVWKQGDPATCILAAAEDQKADLIVMGTRGLSALKGLFVGSVSHKVNYLSKCTCITVK
jgi:nucleotide-binding universal stress UspA family protein